MSGGLKNIAGVEGRAGKGLGTRTECGVREEVAGRETGEMSSIQP